MGPASGLPCPEVTLHKSTPKPNPDPNPNPDTDTAPNPNPDPNPSPNPNPNPNPNQVADPAQLEGESPAEARQRALGVIGKALEGATFAACDEATQITLPLVFD